MTERIHRIIHEQLAKSRAQLADLFDQVRDRKQSISQIEAEIAALEIKIEKTQASIHSVEEILRLDAIPEEIEPKVPMQNGADPERDDDMQAAKRGTRGDTVLALIPATIAQAKDKSTIWQELIQHEPSLTRDATFMALNRLYRKGKVERIKRGNKYFWYRKEENIVSIRSGPKL